MKDELFYQNEFEFEYAERPNKSQIKRDIAEVFKMVEEICHMNEAQIDRLELPAELYKQVILTAKMPHTGARKRQIKYLTAQFRKMDITSIQEKIARTKQIDAQSVRFHHQAEQWRDRLLSEEGHDYLTQLLNEFPHAESQYLRQLQRSALLELKHEKPPKSARALYKYIKELIQTDQAAQ